MHKGKVIANNEPVKPLLLQPTTVRVLSMSPQELEEVKATKQFKSEEFAEKGSDFISYMQKAKSVKEIQKGLYKLCIKYADATHISCAYKLEHPSGPYNQGYLDDEEHGVGRTKLQAMKDRGLVSVAVFIVRFYGGV